MATKKSAVEVVKGLSLEALGITTDDVAALAAKQDEAKGKASNGASDTYANYVREESPAEAALIVATALTTKHGFEWMAEQLDNAAIRKDGTKSCTVNVRQKVARKDETGMTMPIAQMWFYTKENKLQVRNPQSLPIDLTALGFVEVPRN